MYSYKYTLLMICTQESMYVYKMRNKWLIMLKTIGDYFYPK